MTTKIDKKQLFDLYSFANIDLAAKQILSFEYLYSNYDVFLRDNLEKEIQKKVDEINRIGVYNFTEEQLSDFRYETNHYYGLSIQAKTELSNYMIVAVYSFYEKTFKRILGLTHKISEAELKRCYKVKELKNIIKSKFQIDYENLSNSRNIEELRCLNNAIKHNGIVGDELAKINSKWVLNSKIEDTYSDFIRLKDCPYAFLSDLQKKILANFD